MGFFDLFGGGVPAVEAREAHALAGQGWSFLDVREPHEFAAGHIAGARLVPLRSLGQEAGDLASQRWVVVCRSGNRSRAAAAALRRMGADVRNLRGGMLAWQAANLPVKTGSRS